MFHVIKDFTDLEDNNYIYYAGKEYYPRKENQKVSKERLENLSSDNNLRKEILIERIPLEEMKISELVRFAKIQEIKIKKKSTSEEILSTVKSEIDKEMESKNVNEND